MKYFFITFSKIIILSSVAVMLWGCPSPKRTEGVNQERSDSLKKAVDTIIQDAARKKEMYQKELESMNTEQLAKQLTIESDRGLETFNSLAYAEAVSRGKDTAGQLVKQVTATNKSSLLSVLAIKKVDSAVYYKLEPSLRLRVLLDALKTARFYNEFGLPHVKWEEAAQAIISEGRNITDSLEMLLQNINPAPVWGSEDYAEYKLYQYRVCDYAWALLMTIQKQSFTIPQDQKERDKMITDYLKSKKKKG